MATLPAVPPRPLPSLRPGDVLTIPAGTRLVRVYRAGPHGTTWNGFRSYGPTPRDRFDHHEPPPGDHPTTGILYAAGDGVSAIVEAFQADRTIDRRRDDPWFVVFAPTAPLHVLDLDRAWPTRAGASGALATGDAPAITQAWARAIHAEYAHDVVGIVYRSSMRGTPRGPRPRGVAASLFGRNVALFETAQSAFPAHPRLHLPLSHPGLADDLGAAALAYDYDLT